MSSTMEHAINEFNLLEETTPDAIVLEFKDEILSLVEKYSHSGQSGGSAPFTSKIISDVVEKLCMHKPILPITGVEDEWREAGDELRTFSQNKRLSSVFKEDVRAYYLDAIVFQSENGAFTGSAGLLGGGMVKSAQNIKSFPFTPKTFYVDVIETEWLKKEDGSLVEQKGGGWWTSVVKDINQLEAVKEYYDFEIVYPEQD